jgi:hypothetical protein
MFMIRGAEQAFKFTTSFDFEDICNIVAVFSQPHNEGTATAPMPITKYYNRQIEEVDEWNSSDADTTKTYYVGTKYYRYDANSDLFIASNTKPTESDISGGAVTTWPLGDAYEISKVYKCDQSYYQYNPSTQKWDITSDAPSTDLIELSQVGVENIPTGANKKQMCVYNQCYYKHNGTQWQKSDSILPIEETPYWDDTKLAEYDTSKTYCAIETYYKYVDGAWHTYGRDCVWPTEVYAWNSDDTSAYDKSKIYMLKEFYYQYNAETDQFEKTAIREVYYLYNVEEEQWEECEEPDIAIEDIGLWVGTDEHDVNKIYVCKNVYYRYNTNLETPVWEGSNNMLVPVVEIDQWVDEDYHDTSKIYMCRARYYRYNIEKSEWEEKEEAIQPQIVNLDYWTEPTDRDKYQIYLCGPTYYKYDSSNTQWLPSATFNIQLTQIDHPSEAVDESKIYECSPIYYAYKGDTWEEYKNIADASRNDGFSPVDGDPKSFVAMLSAEETMRFNEQYKGRVQVTVYCDTVNRTDKSKVEYFTVYPTMTDEIFSDIAPSDTETVRILDAGEIIQE